MSISVIIQGVANDGKVCRAPDTPHTVTFQVVQFTKQKWLCLQEHHHYCFQALFSSRPADPAQSGIGTVNISTSRAFGDKKWQIVLKLSHMI